jgi:hypothetical protein
MLLVLVSISTARAQAPVSALESLEVGIWPDYDRPSALVLLSGTLGPEVPLPATVTVPVPEDAQLNAVARIDSQQRMIDDIAYSNRDGVLTLTTPDSRFRVEYYAPYRIEAADRIFIFTWLSDLSVGRMNATVQRPASALTLVTDPAASEVLKGRDGLSYHRLPERAVPAGQPFSLQIRYPMAETRLSLRPPSSPAPAPPPAAQPQPEPASGSGSASDLPWLFVIAVIGVGLISALVTWQIARSRAVPAAPSPAGREAPARRHCHACGRPAGEADRFCPGCGAKLSGE